MRHVLVAALGVGLLAGLVGLVGCEAHRGVIADRTKEAIDGMLGKLQVQKKEVEIGLRDLKAGISAIQSAKIESQVRLEQIDKRMKPQIEKKEKIQTALKKVQGWLKDGVSVTVGDQTYDVAKLNKLATDTIAEAKDANKQIAQLTQQRDNMQKVHDSLERKQGEYNKRLRDLENQLATLNDQMIQVEAMQKASALVGQGADDTVTGSIDALEDKITKLDASMRHILLTEDEKFNEALAKDQMQSVDNLINATEDPEDLSSQIDAVLKE